MDETLMEPLADDRDSRAGWIAVSAAFGALGRVFLCLDAGFNVMHASWTLDELLGAGAARDAEGRPAEDLLGSDLFGPASPLRQALLSRERREGWRAEPSTLPPEAVTTFAVSSSSDFPKM